MKNTIFGTQQAVWKEWLWGQSALEVHIRTVAFTTSGSQWLLGVWLYIRFSEFIRELNSSWLPLERYVDANTSLFGLNILHHNLGPQTRLSVSMRISPHHCGRCILIFLFLHLKWKKIQNRTITKMRDVILRRHETSATVKKQDLSSKIGQYRANLISRIEFISSVSITIHQTQTFSSWTLAFTMALATSVPAHIIAQRITETTHFKLQWAKRFEVGRCTF
jgi:hypothetical protein